MMLPYLTHNSLAEVYNQIKLKQFSKTEKMMFPKKLLLVLLLLLLNYDGEDDDVLSRFYPLYPRTHYVDQPDLKLPDNHLSLPPEHRGL